MDPSTADTVLGFFRELFWTIRFLGLCWLLRPLVLEAIRKFGTIRVKGKAHGASFSGEFTQPDVEVPQEERRNAIESDGTRGTQDLLT